MATENIGAPPTAFRQPIRRDQIRLPNSTQQEILFDLIARLEKDSSRHDLGTLPIGDPTIALADALAVTCDVLGLYQERVVNEGYLGTAIEPRSVFELARLMGYAPNPGTSAHAYLAYSADTGIGKPVTVKAGSKVAAMPRPGETPQMFETARDFVAWPELNVLGVVNRGSSEVLPTSTSIFLDRTDLGLSPGCLVAVGASGETSLQFFVVRDALVDHTGKQTQVRLSPCGPSPAASAGAAGAPQLGAVQPIVKSPPPKAVAPTLRPGSLDYLLLQHTQASGSPASQSDFDPLAPNKVPVWAFKRQAAVFGHNAPRPSKEQSTRRQNGSPVADSSGSWLIEPEEIAAADRIDLDGHFPAVLPGDLIGIQIPERSKFGEDIELYRVVSARLISRNAYGITGNATRLVLERAWKSLDWPETFEETIQRPIVHIYHSTGVSIAPQPDTIQVGTRWLRLDLYQPNLSEGRLVIVQGDAPETQKGELGRHPEVRTISEVRHGWDDPPMKEDQLPTWTAVCFDPPLEFAYGPGALTIRANVVEATHGETYQEVLGSGDATMETQSFPLSRKPVSHLAGRASSGAVPQVVVLVGGERWTLVDSLAAGHAGELAAMVQIAEDSSARVVFGDGQFGARPPTGRENVATRYRVGLGAAGNVDADRLKMPVGHPLGITDVTNPIAASGGADPEPIQRVRTNASLATMALGRVVSASDYQAVAQTSPGITKALMLELQQGGRPLPLLTVLGDPASDELDAGVRKALLERLSGASHAALPTLCDGKILTLAMAATVKLADGAEWDQVEPLIRQSLFDEFGFENRLLAQPADASSALRAIQDVEGVDYGELQSFYCLDRVAPTQKPPLLQRVEASAWQMDNGKPLGAELLVLRPQIRDSLNLVERLSS